MNISKETIENIVFLLNKSFEFEGDVFGVAHNLAVDVLQDLECVLKEAE